MGHPVRDKITDRVAARFGGRQPLIPPSRLPQTVEYLRAVFMGLLGGVAVMAVATGIDKAGDAFGVHDDRQYAEASAELTAGERVLAQSVFGPDFATVNIRKYFHRELPPTQAHDKNSASTAAYVLGGNTSDIHFVSRDKQSHDYSRAADQGYRVSTFMHEMTHIWQHRQGMSKDCDIYDYRLSARARFADFCNEQQASIIGDYTRLFLQPDTALAQMAGTVPDITYRSEHRDLMRVVEEQFPHARTARMQMFARVQAAGTCVLTQRQQAVATRTLAQFRLSQVWAQCSAYHITTLNGQRLTPAAASPVLPDRAPRQSTSAQIRHLWARTLG